jgi:hypothetical protein
MKDILIQTTVRIPKSILKALKAFAAQKNMSMNSLILLYIKNGMDEALNDFEYDAILNNIDIEIMSLRRRERSMSTPSTPDVYERPDHDEINDLFGLDK